MNKSAIYLLLLPWLLAGCDDFVDSYPRPVMPYYAIYKTNADYFHYYSTWVGKHGSVNHLLDVSADETIVYEYQGYEGYHLRIKLDSGYYLGGEITYKDVFTDVTFQEYYDIYSTGDLGKLDSLVESRIIDEDPFVAYYVLPEMEMSELSDSISGRDTLATKQLIFAELVSVARKIDSIIAEGSLEECFRRMK